MAVYDLPPYTPMDSYLKNIKTIPRNPTLPQTPLGVYTDSIFEANDAALRSAYLRKYNDLMQQIGYKDPVTGQIIKGDIESAADAQRADLQRSMFLAKVDTINQAQNEGNYFSGYQTVRQARAEYPFAQQIAGLDVSVPKAIASAQEQAAQALDDYIIQRNQEIAQAAQRKADADRNNPPGAPPGTNPPALGVDPLPVPTTPTGQGSYYPVGNPYHDFSPAAEPPAIPGSGTQGVPAPTAAAGQGSYYPVKKRQYVPPKGGMPHA